MGTTVAGLEGVIAGESEICYIDGYQGVLSYRGYNIHTLADNATFEEVIFLLWNGWLPKQAELDAAQEGPGGGARRCPARWSSFCGAFPRRNPMDVLRTAVSMLSLYDPEAQDMSAEANHRKAVRLMAQDRDHRHHVRPPAQGQAGDRRRPEPGLRRQFPVHPDRQAARRRDGARLRRGADPARRSRAERLHLRRARDGGDAVGHLFLGHQRHRRAEGAAARRRQSGRDQVAAGAGR